MCMQLVATLSICACCMPLLTVVCFQRHFSAWTRHSSAIVSGLAHHVMAACNNLCAHAYSCTTMSWSKRWRIPCLSKCYMHGVVCLDPVTCSKACCTFVCWVPAIECSVTVKGFEALRATSVHIQNVCKHVLPTAKFATLGEPWFLQTMTAKSVYSAGSSAGVWFWHRLTLKAVKSLNCVNGNVQNIQGS